MKIRTKIICTIGPAVNSLEKILELIDAGMNVARLNFSHGTHEEHSNVIKLLKQAREQANLPLAICLDTKGPEVRVGQIVGGEYQAEKGDRFFLSDKGCLNNKGKCIPIHPSSIFEGIDEGKKVLFDDGYISSYVTKQEDDGIWIEVENSGVIKSGKGVNFPNTSLNLPAMTEKDIEDIKFGCKHDVDYIAASFIRTAEDVLGIKRLIHEQENTNVLIIAKIENAEGVDNFDHILQIADGIMIARGDLGVEVPLSKVPVYQKMMIRKCYLAGKPSITATQMLESMINNPRPTRAEASDVANAIYDSTTAVMLSGETAIGKYPVETVKMMRAIALEAEANFDYKEFFYKTRESSFCDVPSSVTLAAVKTAYSARAKAIFAFTSSGGTARLASRLRPAIPIIGLTPHHKNYNQLALNWGVIPCYCSDCHDVQDAFRAASQFALEKRIVEYGDLIIITSGTPFGVSGTTNMMLVENIGDVLVRGNKGYGQPTYGKVSLALTPDGDTEYGVRDKIAVILRCDDAYLPHLKEASGIILQNDIDDKKSEQYVILLAKTLDIPVIIRADGANKILNNGQLITLDPQKHLVYKGVVLENKVCEAEI